MTCFRQLHHKSQDTGTHWDRRNRVFRFFSPLFSRKRGSTASPCQHHTRSLINRLWTPAFAGATENGLSLRSPSRTALRQSTRIERPRDGQVTPVLDDLVNGYPVHPCRSMVPRICSPSLRRVRLACGLDWATRPRSCGPPGKATPLRMDGQ